MVVVLAILLALTSAIIRASFRDAPFEPSSPTATGSKALVTVLQESGTPVATVRSTQDAADALTAGGTVVLTDDRHLSQRQRDLLASALEGSTGRIVLITPEQETLDALAPGTSVAGRVAADERPRADETCADASFRARWVRPGTFEPADDSQTSWPGLSYRPAPGAASCFRTHEGASIVQQGRATVLGSSRYVMNGGIGSADNSAVALNAIGGHGEVAWYIPSATDPLAGQDGGPLARLPEWALPVVLWMVACVLLLLLALSFRLGPVVIEPLPVTVRAQELTIGRANLLERAGARDRAARSLRSAAAVRLADRLGVRRSENLEALLTALTPHVRDPHAARALLSATPVSTDIDLVRLAHDLDALEKEIDR